jgi:hypothetical protein
MNRSSTHVQQFLYKLGHPDFSGTNSDTVTTCQIVSTCFEFHLTEGCGKINTNSDILKIIDNTVGSK